MRPEDVPDHLIEKALRAMPTAAPDSVAREVLRLVLAAVVPEIQAQSKEEIAHLNTLLDEFEVEREQLKKDLGYLTDAFISHEYLRRKGLATTTEENK